MILEGNKLYKPLINSILAKMKTINKCRYDFLIEIFGLFMSIKGRINFLQLMRFGRFGEQRYRQQFEKPFDFLSFNKELTCSHGSGNYAIGFDPCHISKSGKNTHGTGWYWSGCAGQSKWGLEIGGIAAIDIDNHTAFHLEAVQTPNSKGITSNSDTLLDWYSKVITDRKESLLKLSNRIVADAYFSKKPFVDKLVEATMHLISRMRNDADLLYLYKGEPTGKKGRPKKYDGKIKFDNIDKNYFELIEKNEEAEIYCALVYSKALKRIINLVYVKTFDKAKQSHKLFFSTDTKMTAYEILDCYKCRFQIEFLYRDGKQHTSLSDCQARSENKLHFHLNASLTSINIAKVTHWLSIPKEERKAFSMTDIKTVYHNILMMERFIKVFAIRPNSIKNNNNVKELIYFGTIAA